MCSPATQRGDLPLHADSSVATREVAISVIRHSDLFSKGDRHAKCNAANGPVEGGHPATGETDNEGNYSLTTFKVGDGAVPGEYIVTVQKLLADEKGGVYAEHRLVTPARYANASHSDLRAKVTSGESNEFDFTLNK